MDSVVVVVHVSILFPHVQAVFDLIEEDLLAQDRCIDLQIDEHYGNCVGCFKKSIRKLATIAKDTPEYFEKWEEMENELKDFKTENNRDPQTGFRRIYRKQNTVKDLIQIGNHPDFRRFSSKEKDSQGYLFDDFDLEFGCGESCEIY